jgi:RNA polymerase sigma-70 factor (ECF subfamily)
MSEQLAPSTHESLLIRVRDAQDDEAWRMFVDLYMPLVHRYSLRLGLQEADAHDATQEVFVLVSRAIRRFEYDPAKGRFRGWLGKIAWQTIRRQQKRNNRPDAALGKAGDESAYDGPEPEGEVDPVWIEEFNTRICQAAIERIRPEFEAGAWRAFELTWIEDRAADEAAQELGRPKSWIYVNKFRVLKRLKEEVQFLTADVAFFS